MTEALQKLRNDIKNVKSSQRAQHTEIKEILYEIVDFLERLTPDEEVKKTATEIIAKYKETANDKTVL